MVCYRHPKVETSLRCSKCERPICPRCMVTTPVGMRCPDCASLRASPLYRIHPGRLALAAIVGLIVGILGAFLLTIAGFFILLIAPTYGAVVAEGVLRAAGRKRGRAMEVIGVGSIVIGGLVALGPHLLLLLNPAPGMGFSLVSLLWPVLGLALAVSTCYTRLKYW